MRSRRVTLAVLLMLSSFVPLAAQGVEELQPAVLVLLHIKGDVVELVSKKDGEDFIRRQYGVPQMEPLFFEVFGAEGEVAYAADLADPSVVHTDGDAGEAPPPGEVAASEGNLSISIPTAIQPRRLVVYRRVSDDLENGRKVLLDLGL